MTLAEAILASKIPAQAFPELCLIAARQYSFWIRRRKPPDAVAPTLCLGGCEGREESEEVRVPKALEISARQWGRRLREDAPAEVASIWGWAWGEPVKHDSSNCKSFNFCLKQPVPLFLRIPPCFPFSPYRFPPHKSVCSLLLDLRNRVLGSFLVGGEMGE